MTKTSIESIRRRELIEATLKVIETHGFHAATVAKISQTSGLSVGIVGHYFGGKQALLEAAMRHQLSLIKRDLANLLANLPNDPHARLMAIVDANFSGSQIADKSAKTWLAFWSHAMHSPALARLQRLNERRLLSNLKFYLRELLPDDQVESTAHSVAALIDGFWLRTALSQGRLETGRAANLCKSYIDLAIYHARELSS